MAFCLCLADREEPWTELTAERVACMASRPAAPERAGQHAVQEGQFVAPACLVPKTPKAALLPSHSSGLSRDFKRGPVWLCF